MSDEEQIPEESHEPPALSHEEEANKNISQKESVQASTLNQENMEVHKHPHHVTHKKRWGEYFLEFLMIFLAVFLGFVAENIREHYVENKRAKEYAKALFSDLCTDTAAIRSDLEGLAERISFQDSLVQILLKRMEGTRVPGAQLYYYSFFAHGSYQFSVKTATLNQLKSSGSLRFFKNFGIIKLINDYDQAVLMQEGRGDVDLSSFNKLSEAGESLFSFYQLEKLEKLLSERPQARDSILNLDLPLQDSGIAAINKFAFAIKARMINLKRRENEYYKNPYTIACSLIEELKKEYHLE